MISISVPCFSFTFSVFHNNVWLLIGGKLVYAKEHTHIYIYLPPLKISCVSQLNINIYILIWTKIYFYSVLLENVVFYNFFSFITVEIHAQILIFHRSMLANTIVNYVHDCNCIDAYMQIYPSYLPQLNVQ